MTGQLNDGAYHKFKLDARADRLTVSADDVTTDVIAHSPDPARFAGRPFVGGVKRRTPEMRDQLLTGEGFVGCIKVCVAGGGSLCRFE